MARKPSKNDRTCKEMTDLLLGYVNNELGTPGMENFEKHLKICPDCVSFLNTYKTTIRTTQHVPVAKMPATVQDKLLAYIRKQAKKIAGLVMFIVGHLTA